VAPKCKGGLPMKNIKNNYNNNKSTEENRLCSQSRAFMQMLTERGILDDRSIGDKEIREATRKKTRIWNGDNSDTKNTIDYAVKKGLNIIIINPNDLTIKNIPAKERLKTIH